MSEVVGALLHHGLNIQDLNEFDYSPYPIFKNMTELDPKKFRIAHLGNKIPMVYAIVARKSE
jgi:hypothetical protein